MSAGRQRAATPARMEAAGQKCGDGLWQAVVAAYKRAQAKGAAYQTETSTVVLHEALLDVGIA